jgi:hypothetical protein
MNRYLIIHRLRWPAILLLTGVIALLDEAHILSWGRAWPLYLILFGVLTLAERATLAQQPMPVDPDYPYGAGYPAQPVGYGPGYAPGYQPTYAPQPGQYPYQGAAPVAPAAPAASTGIVPTHAGLELHDNQIGSNREEEER